MGCCDAWEYHATYAGVAEVMQPGDLPVVVWGRPQAHFCLGQHQSAAAELIRDPGVPVVRRPLGGGGVWLDTNQACVVLVAPREFFPARPADWFDHALSPIVRVYREAGLPAAMEAQDIWLHGRKLAGSGAATIGAAGLVGSSFLLSFPAGRFVQLVAAPSAGFRLWLADALRASLASWSQHAPVPDWEWLSMVYRRAANAEFGWRWEQSRLTDDERAARDGWRAELVPEDERNTRLVPHGIKINAASFLTEREFDGGWVRVLTQGRRLARVALSAAPALPEARLAGLALNLHELSAILAGYIGCGDAAIWAQRILDTAHVDTESA